MRQLLYVSDTAPSLPDGTLDAILTASRTHNAPAGITGLLLHIEGGFLQVLEGEDAVYRWVSGTGLRPFVQALAGEQREAFIADYKAKLNAAYPRRADGGTLFPFERLFVVAVKA